MYRAMPHFTSFIDTGLNLEKLFFLIPWCAIHLVQLTWHTWTIQMQRYFSLTHGSIRKGSFNILDEVVFRANGLMHFDTLWWICTNNHQIGIRRIWVSYEATWRQSNCEPPFIRVRRSEIAGHGQWYSSRGGENKESQGKHLRLQVSVRQGATTPRPGG